MFAAGKCIVEQTRQAERWRLTVECGDSGGDSCLQLELHFGAKEMGTDGDSP